MLISNPEKRERRIQMDYLNSEIECDNCGGTALYDDVEGYCPECGNGWIIDDELFEERINHEMGLAEYFRREQIIAPAE